MTGIVIAAPLAGWAMPLDQVPDPVFAEGMMGEGIAIDPLEGLVVAPAPAIVAAVAETGHAVTLRLANGAHLLIHVGLETVALAGEGFEPCVARDQAVEAGAPLIRFDMDRVARRARSLVTPIVLVDPGFAARPLARDRRVAAGEPLLAIDGEVAQAAAADAGAALERSVTVGLHNGLHARPAARIVDSLRSRAARVEIGAGGRTADARSLVALLSLGLKTGSEALVRASGAEAEAALAAVAALLQFEAEAGTGQPPPASGPATASPGLAVGPVVQFRPLPIEIPEKGRGIAEESEALGAAIAAVTASLRVAADGGTGIAAAHLAIVQDPELSASARTEIGSGRSAAFAWKSATAAASDRIRQTGDPLLIERTADLDDVAQHMLAQLVGADGLALPDLPPGTILVAEDLLPSQLLALRDRLAAVVTAAGGPTSHAAILAASAGIPMLVAAGPEVLAIADGTEVIVDADLGEVIAAPGPSRLAAAREQVAERAARAAAQTALASAPCCLADGERIEVFANLASAADAALAVAAGAEGCGLLRTEFLFLDRAEPPSEEEQAEAYRAIADALGERPLIVRTLDIGADKQLPYWPMPAEANPALGQRGIRLALARPELLRGQLRAILRAVPADRCRIMIPMVVDIAELREVRRLLDAERAALGLEAPVALGVMVETPAAAIMADSLAAEADFLSIGTNDLSQYALACDRTNAATASLADALHPAILRLVRLAASGAARHGRWIGVCGGLASDPGAAPLLVGLGIGELSAVPAAIPAVKAALRGTSREACAAVAEAALACATASEVRRLLADRAAGAGENQS